MEKQPNSAAFRGFQKPNYTSVPDELFDELLPLLTGSELKVLLYIIRRTFGFKKDSDTISLGQMLNGITTRDGRTLDSGAGVSKPALLQALRGLQGKNVIVVERSMSEERGHEPTRYSLNVRGQDPLGKENSLPLVKEVDQGVGKETLPSPWSRKLTIQETVEQETVEQETDGHNSNIRAVEPGRKKQGSTARNGESAPGPEGVGEILARSHGPRQAQTAPARAGAALRPEAGNEDFQRIQNVVMVCQRELGDRATAKSSSTRAWNLYQAAGCSITRFEESLYKARSLTQESTAQIKAVGDDPNFDVRRKIKMPYFFAVLEDVLGLRDAPEKPEAKPRTSSKPAGSGRRKGGEGHGLVPHIET